MSDKTEIEQSNNKNEGDIAGVSIDKSRHYHSISNKQISFIDLLEKLAEEIKTNKKLGEIIDTLEHYKKRVDNEKIIGLEDKLIAGNRSYEIEYALRAKQTFYKKLIEYEYYESAQKVFVHLLANIESYFHTHIYPLIINNEDIPTVNKKMNEIIKEPILQEFGYCILEINAKDVDGMVFFLTGNCFIKWN